MKLVEASKNVLNKNYSPNELMSVFSNNAVFSHVFLYAPVFLIINILE
ncbi:hypothetical protein KGF42_05250 [Clostridioides sp. ZZV15-6383]|nr:hypothetical protein [Clostridioides sp. ZZV14-6345]MCC0698857.1 hypothetical protein [Clostridioides sp. ZZV15-6383]